MNKRSAVVISVVLILITVFNISALAVYNPPDTPNSSYYISSSYASALSGGSGKLKVHFWVTATGNMSSLGSICIDVYKSNGTYVKSVMYYQTGRSGMLASNVGFHDDTETISVASGKYYAVVSIYAQNSSGSDQIAQTTNTVTIP